MTAKHNLFGVAVLSDVVYPFRKFWIPERIAQRKDKSMRANEIKRTFWGSLIMMGGGYATGLGEAFLIGAFVLIALLVEGARERHAEKVRNQPWVPSPSGRGFWKPLV